MVRLTMTQAIVAALGFCREKEIEGWSFEHIDGDPLLVGEPISHGQLIKLSACLRKHFEANPNESKELTYDLDGLLRGSRVYIEPPKPKPEPVSSNRFLSPAYLLRRGRVQNTNS